MPSTFLTTAQLAQVQAELDNAHRCGVYLPVDFYDANLTALLAEVTAARRVVEAAKDVIIGHYGVRSDIRPDRLTHEAETRFFDALAAYTAQQPPGEK